METSRLRLKKQRERQRAKKRAARQLLPEFKRSQCNSKLEQVMDVNSIMNATDNILIPQAANADIIPTHSTPIAGQPNELEMPDFVESAIPKLHLTFPEFTFDSIDAYDDTYVQQKKLQWCEELDSAREEVTEGLRIIRKKAEESLKDVKKKVCEARAHIKVLEHMQQEEGVTIKEDPSIDELGSRGECVSIVQHTEPIDLSALTMDKDKHGIIQQVRRLEKRERQAIAFARNMSKKVENLEMEREKQQADAQKSIRAVRDFWRDKIFERSTRGGMMLMAAARGTVLKLDKYLEADN